MKVDTKKIKEKLTLLYEKMDNSQYIIATYKTKIRVVYEHEINKSNIKEWIGFINSNTAAYWEEIMIESNIIWKSLRKKK